MSTVSMRNLLWRRAKSDWGIVMITLALVVLGLIMIFSVTRELPLIFPLFEGAPDSFFNYQLSFAVIGVAAMILISRIDYRLYRRFAVLIGLGTLALLILMAAMESRFLFKQTENQGEVGRGQLSEVAKYGVIIYLAAWLSSAGGRLRNFRTGMLPASTILLLSCGLVILQGDLSTMMLLGAVCLIMLFVAGANVRQLIVLLLLGALVSAVLIIFVSWRDDRWRTFIVSPFSEPMGTGYQTVRSLIALNNGGLLGQGLAGGVESRMLHYTAATDFMFAMIAEQFGFLGALVVLAFYVAWTWRGIKIAERSVDSFGRLVAVGVVSWEACRALLHVAVVTNTVPVTGTVLPYVSYGGSALVSGLASLGVLVNISRRATLEAEAGQ